MRLIIHMGLHNTGAASMQTMLRRNADALAPEIKAIFPGSNSLITSLAQATWRFAVGRIGRPKLIEEIKRTGDIFREQECETLLISHENLSGAMMGSGAGTAFYPHLREFMDLFDKHFAPLKPEYVFYTRQVDAWLASLHNQVVKDNGYMHDLAHFRLTAQVPVNWEALYDLAREGREFEVFSVEDEPDRARPGRLLLQYAGLDDAAIATMKTVPEERDTSLSPGALEFLRICNCMSLDPKLRRELSAQALEHPDLFDPLTQSLTPPSTKPRGI